MLHWVSDRDGWWNLYREDEQLTDEQAELGYPQWRFGGSSYAFLDGGASRPACGPTGLERLCLLPRPFRPEDLGLPYTAVGFPDLRRAGRPDPLAKARRRTRARLVSWSAAEGVRVLSARRARVPRRLRVGARARAIKFPSAGGRTAHAF